MMSNPYCWRCDKPSKDLQKVGDLPGETRGGASVMWCGKCRQDPHRRPSQRR